MKATRLLIAWVLPVFVVAGCDEPSPVLERLSSGTPMTTAPRPGALCTVQFRRDALGAGANLPVPPTTDSINGADVSLSGTFLRMDDHWIVLEWRDGDQLWIPREAVLLLRVSRPDESSSGGHRPPSDSEGR